MSHGNTFERPLLLRLAVLLWTLGPTAGLAYEFQIIAQEGDVIDGRRILGFSIDPNNVAINNDREVAFFAGVSWQGSADWALMTQRRFIAGAGKEIDGRLPSFNDEDHWVDINNVGKVAYTAFLPEGGRGLFVNETLLLEPGDAVDGRTLTLIGREPQINDSGTIVFEARYEGHAGDAVFTQYGLIAEQGQTLDGYTLGTMAFPQLNNRGEVAIWASLLELETVQKTGVISPDRVILKPGDMIEGMTVERLDSLGTLSDSGELSLLVVAYSAVDGLIGFIATPDRVLRRPGDTVGGIELDNVGDGRPVLNNAGNVAFIGLLQLEDGGYRRILFAGDQVVASEGDVLDGKVITRIYPNFDMNDRGDVAFRVQFEGPERPRGIILATVPEPKTWALLATGCLMGLSVWHWRPHFCEVRRN